MLNTKTLKYGLVVVVTFAFLCFVFYTRKKTKQRWIVEKTISCAHWKKRVKEIESVHGKYKPIFLGNSLTEMFDIQGYFNDTTILNCGIVGDFTEGLLKRSDAIISLKPNKLFIEIGINDMIEKISLEEICDNYEKLLIKIKQHSPQTKIYIQSNLPVIINRPSLLTTDADVNKLVVEQNKNLQILAKKYNCTYIDIFSELIKEKDKPSLFIWDGIHLTPKAYEIWTVVVKPYLISDR